MNRRSGFIIALLLFFIGGFIYTLVYFSAKPAVIAGANPQNIYYHHKTIPVVVQNEIITALNHYPELKETPIDFVFDPNTSKSIMLSQPVIATFLKGRQNRGYVVKINPRFVMVHSSMAIQNVPKEILIGWFGHELGHILDYSTRSNADMIVFGIMYICSDKYLMQAERNADMNAVNHNMGDYIVKTKNYILNNADLPAPYKARIKRLYLSPQQIIDLVKKLKKPVANKLSSAFF